MENCSSLDCELVPDNDLCVEVQNEDTLNANVDNVIEISHEYTGESTSDIDVTVDNTNYTISAELSDARKEQLDNIPKKTSDLTNDGDGSSPFATQEYVEENGGKIDSISVNGDPQTIDANKNVDIDVPTALSDLTNDANFVQDANYVHTDNNYTNEAVLKLSGIESEAQVNDIEHIAVDGVEQTITDKSVNIDLTGKQDVLTAGDNIDITNNEISAKDVVTTNTAQTISGQKTFGSNIKLSSGVGIIDSVGNSILSVSAGNLNLHRNTIPSSTNSFDLGNSSKQWKDVHIAGQLKDGSNSVSVSDLAGGLTRVSDLESGKVDKVTSANKVYTTDAQGAQSAGTYSPTGDATPLYFVTRDANGQIIVLQTPTADTHATSKKYVDDRFNGASKPVAYASYEVLVQTFNQLSEETYNVGQDLYVVTTGVPDLWISAIVSEPSTYTYVDDATFTAALESDGYVQIGYYKVSALETQKVDLTDYVTTTQLSEALLPKANDADVVHTTGNENIDGTKTFLGQQRFKKASEGGGYFYVSPDGNGYNVKIGFSSGGQMMIHNGGFQIDRNLYPMTANSNLDLGTSSILWRDLYLKGNLKDNNGNTITIADIANKAALAPAYDSTATYAVGDVVVYGKKLYICFTAVETAEAFDSTKWTEITVDSNYVDKTTAETISGQKTFSSTVVANDGVRTNVINGLSGTTNIQVGKTLMPAVNNDVDLGSSNRKWLDLYLSGKLKDGTNEIAIADIANKNIVGFPIIPTPSSTTLTNDEKNAIKAGGIVNGNISGLGQFQNYVFFPAGDLYSGYYMGFLVVTRNGYSRLYQYAINNSTNLLSFYGQKYIDIDSASNFTITGLNKADFGNNATITRDNDNRINLNYANDAKVKVGSAETLFTNRIGANSDNSQDIGRSTVRWKDLYLAGNLTDGTNSISIANIQPKLTAGTNITIDANNVISAAGGGGNEKEIVELSIVGSAETYTYTDEEQQSQTLHFLCFDIDDTDWAKLTDKVTVKLSLSYTPQVGDDISDGMLVTHDFSSWSGIPSELNVLTFDLNNDYEIAENEWFVEGTVVYFDIGETDPAKGLFTTYGMIDNKIEQISVPTKTSDLTNDGDGTSNFATMADLPTVPTNVSAFTNDAGYLTNYTETDPTVPSWAKASSKPTYSYSEITNTPDLSNFITNTVNDLTNYYLKSETYTQTEIDNRISAIPKFNIRVVSSLPVTDISETTLYLLPNSGSGTNVYDEYIYVNKGTEQLPVMAWEKLGTQTVDLSGYVQTSRKINNHALTADITLTADDIGDGSTNKAYTATEKTKLGNIESGAQVNVIESIKVNGTAVTPTNKEVDITIPAGDNQTVKAGNVTFGANDVVEIEAGSNVTVTGDATNKKITIAATDTTYSAATTSAAGLMPALDSASVSTQSQSTKFLREDGTWSAPSYSDVSGKMDAANPTGTGSLSLNRKANTTIGNYSVAEGYNCEASGSYSHAEGRNATASNSYSHAEGYGTIADGASSHAEGANTAAGGGGSHAEGQNTSALGWFSHAEGYYTKAQRKSQHVFGEYNVLDTTGSTDTRGAYVEIVGNGTASNAKSNARTLDWSGNEWLAGNLQASGLTDGTTTKTMAQVLAGDGISSTDVTITEVD